MSEILDTAADASTLGDEIELLTFRSGEYQLAIEVCRILEIRGWSPITPIPRAALGIVGVMNIRGSLLPVVDLSILTSGRETEQCSRSVVIVTENEDGAYGILVDSVSDIVYCARDAIVSEHQSGHGEAMSMRRQFVNLDDSPVQILSADHLDHLRQASGQAIRLG
jgi:purine-binding chemotaxis protein CheW